MRFRWIALAIAQTTIALTAWGVEFEIQSGAEGNSVVFASHAPMESFEGSTTEIAGRISVDADAIEGPVQAHVVVELKNLKTGKKLRDKHMHENHLETDEFPRVSFTATELVGATARELSVGRSVSFRIRGTFDLHGVQRTIEAPVEATLVDAEHLHVVARFPVLLSDYQIERPKFLFMKLGEEQQITVDFVARKVN
jgi:polyisoprenoid-binding protein YceI